MVAPVSAVRTTGIYCLPDCTARPDPSNVTEFPLPAAAEAAGYRACLRCRPYRHDAPVGDIGPDLVCRAVRMVVAGALDGTSEAELAAEVGVSARHLRRLFDRHLGVSPDGLARSRRAHFARRLLDDTDLPVTDVAFAAGYGSVRQLQRACAEVFRASPSELRSRRRRSDRLVADGGLDVRLGHEGPLDWEALLEWLAIRTVEGVEMVEGGTYRRTVTVDGSPGVIELRRGGADHLVLRAHLPHWEGLIHLVARARTLASLDLDLEGATVALSDDPLLGALVAERPGLRPPGAWDGFETAIRLVIGQQVSVATARELTSRLVRRHGREVPGVAALGLGRTFPGPDDLAGGPLGGLGLTAARERAIGALATAVASGKPALGTTPAPPDWRHELRAIPGIGPWTLESLALRLGEPDAFPSTDAALRRALGRLGAPGSDGAARLEAVSASWSPWRALAATHLWARAGGQQKRRQL